MDINGKKELLQVTGLQGKHECMCEHSHTKIVNTMTNNDIHNVLLLLDNEHWMVTLIEKIDSLLLSLDDNNELSPVLNDFISEKCVILKAKSFFTILDDFKKIINSSTFQMDKTKICVIPYSFHAQIFEVSPLTKLNVKEGENSSVMVIKATETFDIPPFQVVKKYMRLHFKFESTIVFEGQVNDYLYCTSLHQVTGAYSFYDLLILNTSEKTITIDKSMVLATITFMSPLSTPYKDQLIFKSTNLHSLLASATTSEEILNQHNKAMYIQSFEMYMDKL